MNKKDALLKIFLDALLSATQRIESIYFHLPVANGDNVYRERPYCYELYHQLRNLLPKDFPFALSGEVHKRNHPHIGMQCGSIMPDFLVHTPGEMGPNDNLLILEVKSTHRIESPRELLKDIDTINCMTHIENGYYRGLFLIYGPIEDKLKAALIDLYSENCNPASTILIFHEKAGERGIIHQ